MSEESDNALVLATACPHCSTECEFDLPEAARTDVELASQIRIVCHNCDELFQPVGDDLAGSLEDEERFDPSDRYVDPTSTDDNGGSDHQSDSSADKDGAKPAPAQHPQQSQAKRSSFGIIVLSLSISLLASAIAGAGYWIANSSNPAIKSFVETRVLKIEPARFEATRANFERKQTEMGETLQILVEIANIGGQAATPKDVSLQLLDSAGETVFSWIMDTSKTVIEPGTSANYLARMVAPPADIADIRVLIPTQN